MSTTPTLREYARSSNQSQSVKKQQNEYFKLSAALYQVIPLLLSNRIVKGCVNTAWLLAFILSFVPGI